MFMDTVEFKVEDINNFIRFLGKGIQESEKQSKVALNPFIHFSTVSLEERHLKSVVNDIVRNVYNEILDEFLKLINEQIALKKNRDRSGGLLKWLFNLRDKW